MPAYEYRLDIGQITLMHQPNELSVDVRGARNSLIEAWKVATGLNA